MNVISRSPGNELNQLLSKLNLGQDFAEGQVRHLSTTNLAALRSLAASTNAVLAEAGTSQFRQMMQAQDRRLPPFGWNRPPQRMLSSTQELAGAGYSSFENINLVIGNGEASVTGLFQRRHRNGVKLQRLLGINPEARTAFESSVGGRIIRFGQRGRLHIQRFSPAEGAVPAPPTAAAAAESGQHVAALTAMGALGQMEAAIMAQARRVAAVQSQQSTYGTAQAGTYGGGGGGGSSGYTNTFGNFVVGGLSNVSGHSSALTGGSLGGAGVGSWNPLAEPGRINNTDPQYEYAHQAQLESILVDPSLTIEDKVTLLLMTVANKQDSDILRQGQYIASVQQQQSDRSGNAQNLPPADDGTGRVTSPFTSLAGVGVTALGRPAPSGPVGPGGAPLGIGGSPIGGVNGGQLANPGMSNSPSIDVETMKLKRMIDKRSQMFDMLRSIIDKYNETAKGIIQSIGR